MGYRIWDKTRVGIRQAVTTNMEYAQLDEERQKKAKQYAHISRRLMVVELLLTGFYALAWLFTGWSIELRDWLLQFTASPWLLILLFAAFFGGIYYLISLPLSFYSGFLLPHQFEQSNQTLNTWLIDQLKTLLIGGFFGAIILEVIYFFLRTFPFTWWLWASGIILLFNVILANLAPIFLFPIFYQFVPLNSEHAELVDRLTRLSKKAGTVVKGVYKFDMSRRTKSANAALTGLGSTRRIILGDTLLNSFSVDEIETIFAHELGHHVNKDIPLSIAFETILTLGGLFLASGALQSGTNFFGLGNPADPSALPLFILVMGTYGLITMPISNSFSRWREVLADRYALQTTRNGRAFASAMTRLANQNLSVVEPEPWIEFLLYSHPALWRRIKMAQDY